MNLIHRFVRLRLPMGVACATFLLLARASAEWIALHDTTGWWADKTETGAARKIKACLLYTSPSPRD